MLNKLPPISALPFLLGLVFSASTHAESCDSDNIKFWAKADYATSGGQVIVEGQRFKLIGLEPPRIEKTQKFFTSGQPMAKEAQTHLNKILANHDLQVGIEYDEVIIDEFNRSLAHLFVKDKQGKIKSVQALMLEAGFALANTTPPNLKHQNCYYQAEKRARDAAKVLWSVAEKRPDLHYPIVESTKIYAEDTGFRLVKGKVQSVQKSSNNIIINLDTTGIRVRPEDWSHFNYRDVRKLKGKIIEARGQLFHFKGAMYMRIKHPNTINLLNKSAE